jgi:hypothetical protein
MLSINKKNGAKSPAPSAKQTGLFIDPDKRTVDEGGMVIDMPATTASAESAAPDRVEAKPVGGFRGFTVKKKTGGDSDEPGSSNDSGAKAGAFSSLSQSRRRSSGHTGCARRRKAEEVRRQVLLCSA